jgi:DNA-binding MarR family transcriptional regulator
MAKDEIAETEEQKKARKAEKKALKEARKAELKADKKAAKKAEKLASKNAAEKAASEAAGQPVADAGLAPRVVGTEGAGAEAEAPILADPKSADKLSALLQGAARHVRTILANKLLAHGLYAGQEQVLFALDENGPQSLGDLASGLGVRAPTITKTVSRMESQGFLSRAVSVEDARSVIISLTPAGRVALGGARASLIETEKQVFAGLKKAERKELNALLLKLFEPADA